MEGHFSNHSRQIDKEEENNRDTCWALDLERSCDELYSYSIWELHFRIARAGVYRNTMSTVKQPSAVKGQSGQDTRIQCALSHVRSC
jgi:hypothetical protein